MNDRDVTLAICELLGRMPGWSWDPSGPYPVGQVVIFYGAIPPAPDRAIGVRVYGGTDNAQVYQPVRRVQLRFRGARGAPDDADQMADWAFRLLHGASRIKGLNHVERSSFGPLGADQNGRQERTDNYVIILDNLEASK